MKTSSKLYFVALFYLIFMIVCFAYANLIGDCFVSIGYYLVCMIMFVMFMHYLDYAGHLRKYHGD
jgi:hypothetical protein